MIWEKNNIILEKKKKSYYLVDNSGFYMCQETDEIFA